MGSDRRHFRRTTAAAVALVVTATLLTGCTKSVTVDGVKISNAADAVNAASARLRADNKQRLDDGSTTVSDKTTCFFVRAGKDSADVQRQLACGPVRRLGRSDSSVWDRYDLKLEQDAHGKATATVQEASGVAQPLDPGLLLSPSGAEPARVTDVPAPRAPKTEVTNAALVTDSANGMNISFRSLGKPWRINTPAAAIDVTATATPPYVPAELISGGIGGDPGSAPYYRPADGQKVYAYKIKLSPSPESAISYAGHLAGTTVVNEASSVSLGIPGGKSINITDASDADSGADPADSSDSQSATWSIDCGAPDGGWAGSSFPCTLGASNEVVLLATAPAAQAPTLAAAVNGETQTLDLGTGSITSSVSSVEYTRSTLSVRSGKQLIAKATTKVNYAGDIESYPAVWSETVDSMSLSAFDPEKGWAPKGSAWLSVMLSNEDSNGYTYAYSTVDASDVSLTAAGRTYKITATDATKVWLFAVPDSVRSTTFSYQPRGTFTEGDSDRAFAATKASVTVTFLK